MMIALYVMAIVAGALVMTHFSHRPHQPRSLLLLDGQRFVPPALGDYGEE